MMPYRPLAGVRILSLEVAASLPAGTRTLADLGADVLRVAEPPGKVNPYTRIFDSSLINKRSVVLNLREDGPRNLAKRLALVADVVCSNFRPHVMKQFGLSAEELLEIRPELIVLQLTGYGGPGPWSSFPAYGPSVEAAGGMNALMGGHFDLPQRVGGGVFADTLAGRYAALAICGALARRQDNGRGGYIDLSMYECIVTGLGDEVLKTQRTESAPKRIGNRSEHFAPQGVYRCAGEDQWLALSVTSNREWTNFAGLLEEPILKSRELKAVAGRFKQHDLIDACISAWSACRTKEEAAEALQAVGVPAGPVNRPRDLPLDPQYAARGFFQMVRHEQPILGFSAHPHMRVPHKFVGHPDTSLSKHEPEGFRAEEALTDWLDLSAPEVLEMRANHEFGEPRALLPDGTESPGWFGSRHSTQDVNLGERLGLPR